MFGYGDFASGILLIAGLCKFRVEVLFGGVRSVVLSLVILVFLWCYDLFCLVGLLDFGVPSGLSWFYVVFRCGALFSRYTRHLALDVLVALCDCCFDLDFDVGVCTFDRFAWLWVLISRGFVEGVLDCSWFWGVGGCFCCGFCLVGMPVLGVW